MCGIAGMVSQTSPVDEVALARMRDTMRHRGPDDAGLWRSPDGRVGLAHRRLAIIDLSPAGHQPMLDGTRNLCIVFNGEIYNYADLRDELENKGHVFRSASDTEVILEAYRAWGTECLARFNGMFAFAIYDSAEQRLFMARDRAGEKPLFYCQDSGRFIFASELKAIMAAPEFARRLDLVALEFYLTYGNVPGERCILRNARKLPPAHALTLSIGSGELRVWRYWSLPEPQPAVATEADDLKAELNGLLRDSVRRQLVADVPVGILLSGGIDSSLVTAMAAQVSARPVKTFTIGFPGHGSYDESQYARRVAAHFGTEHTDLPAEPASVELLPELARQYDEPMCDSSMLPTYLVSRLIRKHCTVALGGDGGDELFGGYGHYSHLHRQQRLRKLVPTPIRAAVAAAAERVLPIGLKGRNYLLGLKGRAEQGIARVHIFFDPSSRKRLLKPLGLGTNGVRPVPESYQESLCETGRGLPGEAMAVDFQTYLPDDILVKVDRASMLSSLEVRAPFLDYRIIEFAFRRVPNALRATLDERKILPRLLAADLLPKSLDLRRKQGFSLPLKTWFKGEWGRYTEEVLREADPALFDRRAIQSLVDGQRRGRSNTERLFALTLFELWRREYKVSLS